MWTHKPPVKSSTPQVSLFVGALDVFGGCAIKKNNLWTLHSKPLCSLPAWCKYPSGALYWLKNAGYMMTWSTGCFRSFAIGMELEAQGTNPINHQDNRTGNHIKPGTQSSESSRKPKLRSIGCCSALFSAQKRQDEIRNRSSLPLDVQNLQNLHMECPGGPHKKTELQKQAEPCNKML